MKIEVYSCLILDVQTLNEIPESKCLNCIREKKNLIWTNKQRKKKAFFNLFFFR